MSNPLLDSDQAGAASGRSLARALRAFVSDRFDLRADQAYEGHTLESVRKDVQFRGANLWILMFAILICSIGLNVNSPAVVIGAMLISPLMGPILGVGVGVAIYDFDLLLTALKNLAIATLAAVAVSALYFALSPITEAQSELLARTNPTLWDVLVATFGGFAGIIAVSRREKGNALPGVAIATALMPPVCTAGFSVATGQWEFFFGSLYLFFINLTFIALATFVLARSMHFTRQTFVDERRERRVRRWTYVIAACVAVPSVYTAYVTVEESLQKQRISAFVDRECDFAGAEVIARHTIPGEGDAPTRLELVVVGDPVSEEQIAERASRLERYGLPNTDLVVMQDAAAEASAQFAALEQQEAMAMLYRRNQEADAQREARIAALEAIVRPGERSNVGPSDPLGLGAEAEALYPALRGLRFARLPPADSSAESDVLGVAYAAGLGGLDGQEAGQLSRWLARRTGVDSVLLVR